MSELLFITTILVAATWLEACSAAESSRMPSAVSTQTIPSVSRMKMRTARRSCP
jgi:hypothetical protein